MKQFLIWSNEHGAWWRPCSCGYTNSVAEAGLYTKEEAESICKNANYDPARLDEEMRPAADYVDQLLSDDWADKCLDKEMKITLEDADHLSFIYERMAQVHGEPQSLDYMKRFRRILCTMKTVLGE